ncbi:MULTISPECIES: PaaI family thioesterase [Chryseobacterium]|uniref:1,4-dihydroxy-2-naphthoyl-CoA hydrolase n=1 Tax=Chryseobacterium camelliae TaxID=1265445 RepID=A0ABU0TLE1_9FLAO|nr:MULTISPECIES: PaaI family thioesterase [Chryseobacterium]MDT3409104.1 1,4-dihydroxy-2-naphthoyl-CoA hydrolase [Pseudacidovorax intermedius]MDQ1097038.1 1,4-dihydroxy-2-naphthoyl-CoA hydrolase [Chryseobacterium camelliae]MDQ1100976.1 1,4-dihydroxy-2-naphthoyl-CoA hydrolase [Chryseobacterium sp. SORGH_AS_1048]MDR6084418.1 1,4-dihydroxy-2-naphthoyl-CoA hydrolase [Chryseobacterium sp. SORGH_AS_0909]MDR6132689.1 1,4-dihydroxy-2-naphthoyl-CoA hydrolase [Chryseobacterium sp. SORGH_AS_1175]
MQGTKEEILAYINDWGDETFPKALDIKFTDIDLENETLTATMPVLPRIHQPFGIMHGGASCVLAETLGSSLSNIFIDGDKYYGVGTNINTNHLRSKKDGIVTGFVRFIRKGKSMHVSEIEIRDEKGQLISHTTMTNAIIHK